MKDIRVAVAISCNSSKSAALTNPYTPGTLPQLDRQIEAH